MSLAAFRGWLTGNVDRLRLAGYSWGALVPQASVFVEGDWSQKLVALSAYASAGDTAVTAHTDHSVPLFLRPNISTPIFLREASRNGGGGLSTTT